MNKNELGMKIDNNIMFFKDFKNIYIGSQGDLMLCMHQYVNHPEQMIIEKIKYNEGNVFDFSKNLIDIGACIGIYSFSLPFKKSYMFEPNKDASILAQANMIINDKKDYVMYNNLLSDEEEKIIDYDGFSTEYTLNNYNKDNVVQVKSKKLDSFNFENIGLIKIDVEGMEYHVLKGAKETLEKHNYPPILFELWDVGYWGMDQERYDRLIDLLRNEYHYNLLMHWGDHETHLALNGDDYKKLFKIGQ